MRSTVLIDQNVAYTGGAVAAETWRPSLSTLPRDHQLLSLIVVFRHTFSVGAGGDAGICDFKDHITGISISDTHETLVEPMPASMFDACGRVVNHFNPVHELMMFDRAAWGAGVGASTLELSLKYPLIVKSLKNPRDLLRLTNEFIGGNVMVQSSGVTWNAAVTPTELEVRLYAEVEPIRGSAISGPRMFWSGTDQNTPSIILPGRPDSRLLALVKDNGEAFMGAIGQYESIRIAGRQVGEAVLPEVQQAGYVQDHALVDLMFDVAGAAAPATAAPTPEVLVIYGPPRDASLLDLPECDQQVKIRTDAAPPAGATLFGMVMVGGRSQADRDGAFRSVGATIESVKQIGQNGMAASVKNISEARILPATAKLRVLGN